MIENETIQRLDDPTFQNHQSVSRLSGISVPATLTPQTTTTFIAQARDDAELRYVPPEDTQKSIGFYFNLVNPKQNVDEIITTKNNEFIRKVISAKLNPSASEEHSYTSKYQNLRTLCMRITPLNPH